MKNGKQTAVIRMVQKESTNKIYSGVHWRVRQLLKDNYLYEIKKCKGLFHIPVEYPVDLELTFEFSGKTLDSSNCSYMGKIVEDCLVKIGIFPNDSIKYIRSVKYTSVKGKNNLIYISY
jgi:hypothetical protein